MKSILQFQKFLGLVEMTSGLVNASFKNGSLITRHIKTLQDTGLQNVRDLETCM